MNSHFSEFWLNLKQKLLFFFGRSYSPSSLRKVYLNGKTENVLPFSNVVRNQKYSILTFIPIVLYNQFKLFYNLFFLLTALSQLIPELKVGFLFAYMAPLAFVLGLTMIKEGVEDIIRFKRDREANSSRYKVLTSSGQYRLKLSSDIKTGDIIEICANNRVPADLVLLYTNNPEGTVFIRTDQLDGETDWKLRSVIPFLHKNKSYSYPFKSLATCPGFIETTDPNENIYEFTATFHHEPSNEKEALGLENTLWANTVLASGKILGLVIHCGKETKMQKSAKTPRMKFGKLDHELNFISVMLFLVMIALSFAIVIISRMPFTSLMLMVFFRFVLLLCSIIPVSMKVNLEIAKLVYCYKISSDKDIKGTITRNLNIPEELGKIQFLLTDKTGTLTKNEMIFKKLQLYNTLYNYPFQKSEMQKTLHRLLLKDHSGDSFSSEGKNDLLIDIASQTTLSKQSLMEKASKRASDKKIFLKEAILAMSLCHNVTPIYDEIHGSKIFQASSPDEIALVTTAEELHFSLSFRDQNKIVITIAEDKNDTYEILASFPFNSETKRMGIILRNNENHRIYFYVKGADSVMKNMVSSQQSHFIIEECDNLAREGLRTLVFARKSLSELEYEKWASDYKEASSLMSEREIRMRECIEKLEKNLEFVAITGVEDLLQDDVAQTLENMRQAGVSMWMLTGDKVATAICIGISAGLKAPNQDLFVIKEMENIYEIEEKLQEFQKKPMNSTVLVIDGVTLKHIIELEHLNRTFFMIATKAPAVICCRCSPTQKTLLTQSVKNFTKKVVLAVGDGGNDVGMIQCADVGVGIVGKEGKQAALAADYSIEKFSYLNKLMFWHGRLSYKRSAVLSQFIIHRGLIISFIQAIFSCTFYFVAISIFNGTLLMGYSTFYTMFPVFCLIFDEDITVETALGYPPLYKTLQNGRDINVKSFLEWIWRSLYQATIIILLSLHNFDNAFLKIVTITFSCLILTEFLNLYTVLNRLHIFMIISQLISVLLYFISIATLRTVLDVSYITWMFLLKVTVITAISFIPLYVITIVRRRVNPTDFEKVMMNVKRDKIKMTLN